MICTFTVVENSERTQTVMLFRTMQQESPAAVICHCYHGYSSEQKYFL